MQLYRSLAGVPLALSRAGCVDWSGFFAVAGVPPAVFRVSPVD